MYLIEFFGAKVKPRMTRGKGMWKPLETGWLNKDIFAIRDKDVNCFLIRGKDGFIAIDSGYKDNKNVRAALGNYNIAPTSVKVVLLTHLDIDHAGGMDVGDGVVFPNAQVYLSWEEQKYLVGEYVRKKVTFHNCKLPISLSSKVKAIDFGDKRKIDGVEIETEAAVGHTLGHTAYLINNQYFFTGDCLIAGKDGGYCFYDFWNADSVKNIRTLEKLRLFCSERNIRELITSHSGVVKTEDAFLHYDESPKWKAKGFHFIDGADDDPYSG